jgi:predicted SAM-dependent methyltransferase
MPNTKLNYYRSSSFNPTLKNLIKFNFTSLIHKRLFFWYWNIKPKNNYLNLGCGPQIIDDFDNADVPAIKFWQLRHIPVNLLEKLPFKDESYKGVYTEHTLEHLTPFQTIYLLNEVKRILKPNGFLRIVVPDLDIYISNTFTGDENLKHFYTTAESFWNLTQNWGHKNVYNFEILEILLTELGYFNISRQKFRHGVSNMLVDQESRKWESLYVEAQKR